MISGGEDLVRYVIRSIGGNVYHASPRIEESDMLLLDFGVDTIQLSKEDLLDKWAHLSERYWVVKGENYCFGDVSFCSIITQNKLYGFESTKIHKRDIDPELWTEMIDVITMESL